MSADIPVQCCRCKNKHMHSERDSVYDRKNGWSDSVCPRCGAKSYFDCSPLVAWCWASGRIDVGAEMPQNSADGSGAIQIASGPKSQLMLVLDMFALRHPTFGHAVPGIDGAATQREAGDALAHWLANCKQTAKRRQHMKEVVFNLPVQWKAI